MKTKINHLPGVWTKFLPLFTLLLVLFTLSTGFARASANGPKPYVPTLYQPTNFILYVNKNVDVHVAGYEGNGSSWEQAIPELADALLWVEQHKADWTSAEPLSIYVAAGTYKPKYSPDDLDKGQDGHRKNTFLLSPNVKIYGGFAGNESNLSQRNWATNVTVLTGEIQGDNQIDNNAYHVVMVEDNTGFSTLDGFVIEGGRAMAVGNVIYYTVNGKLAYSEVAGGIMILGGKLNLKNSYVRKNSGGSSVAIANEGGEFTMTNVVVAENFAERNTHTISSYDIAKNTFTNVTIANNNTTNIIYFGNQTLNTINNSIITPHPDQNTGSAYLNTTFNNSVAKWEDIAGTNYNGDPVFVDIVANNYQLAPNSPAINRGSNSLYLDVAGTSISDMDVAGQTRILDHANGGKIDAGAYEYQVVRPVIVSAEDLEVFTVPLGVPFADLTLDQNEVLVNLNTDEQVSTPIHNFRFIWELVDPQAPAYDPDVPGDYEYYVPLQDNFLYENTAQIRTKVIIRVKNPVPTFSVQWNGEELNVDEGLTLTYGDLGALSFQSSDPTAELSLEQVSGTTAVLDFANLDQVRASTAGTATYSLSQEATNNSQAYSVSFVVVVEPKMVSVQANAGTKVYGTADPELTYTVTPALVTGDVPTGQLARSAGEVKGEYAISIGNLSFGPNYTVGFTPNVFRITEGTISGVSLNDGSFIYNGTAQGLAISGSLPEGTHVTYANNSRTDVGSQTVTATISGENYTTLVLTATLEVRPATRTLTFAAIPNKTYGDAEFLLDATASSGENVLFTSSNPAIASIVDGNKVRILGAGTVQLTATLPDNTNYESKPSVTQTLVIQKASQTITFTLPSQVKRDAGSLVLNATSTSGLPVVLSINDPMIAALSGNQLHILRLGTLTVTARQAGNENYHAADEVLRTLHVVGDTLGQDANDELAGLVRVHPAVSPSGDGINDVLIIEGIKDFPTNKLTILNLNGAMVWEAQGYNNESISFKGISKRNQALPKGTYFYILEVNVNGEWKVSKGFMVLRF